MQARKAVQALAWGAKFPGPHLLPVADTRGLVVTIIGTKGVFLLEEIVNLFVSNGMAVAIIIYFLYKDYKFNEQILGVLQEVKEVLTALQTWHAKEDA